MSTSRRCESDVARYLALSRCPFTGYSRRIMPEGGIERVDFCARENMRRDNTNAILFLYSLIYSFSPFLSHYMYKCSRLNIHPFALHRVRALCQRERTQRSDVDRREDPADSPTWTGANVIACWLIIRDWLRRLRIAARGRAGSGENSEYRCDLDRVTSLLGGRVFVFFVISVLQLRRRVLTSATD